MAYLDNVYAVVQIAPTGIPTYVRLSQNENGRILNFAISGDALPAGSTVALTGTKPDGAVYSASGTLADNVATFNEDEQLTAISGEWDAKVEVTNSGNLIATGRIKFVIDADPSGGNIPSDSQLDGYIAEMLSLLDTGKAEAYGSPLVASTVAGMTDQSRVYVYTGSETGYTAGNWYYWNGSAWTSGGVYNAVAINTDTTLSVSGMAADAKATGDAIQTDTTLSVSGKAADAKVTGDEIAGLKDDLSNIQGISDEVKVALLACFDHVAWIDDSGQDCYDALYEALYEEEPSVKTIEISGSQLTYGYGYSNAYVSEYGTYSYRNAKRASYLEYNLPSVVGGESYKVEWDNTILPNSQMALNLYTEDVFDYVDLHENTGPAEFDIGWILNGDVIKIPSTFLNSPIVGFRITFKANDGDTVSFSGNEISWIKFTEDTETPDTSKVRVLTQDELLYQAGIFNRSPYYDDDKPSRICYYKFDFDVTPSASYLLGLDTRDYPNGNIIPCYHNQSAVNAYNNNQEVNSSDTDDSDGWKTNGTVVTVPSTINGQPTVGARFSLRPQSSASGTFSSEVRFITIKPR